MRTILLSSVITLGFVAQASAACLSPADLKPLLEKSIDGTTLSHAILEKTGVKIALVYEFKAKELITNLDITLKRNEQHRACQYFLGTSDDPFFYYIDRT